MKALEKNSVNKFEDNWSMLKIMIPILVLIEELFVQLVRRYVGGHKGPISCLMTFLASSGEVLKISSPYMLAMSASALG
jgi:hypothetical protein